MAKLTEDKQAEHVYMSMLTQDRFFGIWSDVAGVKSSFEFEDDLLTDEDILAAFYEYEDYSGNAVVFFKRDGKLYEVHGSHCSCNGLEGQWLPEETLPEAVLGYNLDPEVRRAWRLRLSVFRPIPGVTVIGFGHKARHGKDAAVAAIHAMHPRYTMRFAFGDALKVIARYQHGMAAKDAVLLQKVGQAARDADAEVWVRLLYHQIDEWRPRVALISDVRHVNEADMVRSMGGKVVKVERFEDGQLYIDRSRPSGHVSETMLDQYDWDYVIRNDRGLGDLETAATAAFYELK